MAMKRYYRRMLRPQWIGIAYSVIRFREGLVVVVARIDDAKLGYVWYFRRPVAARIFRRSEF